MKVIKLIFLFAGILSFGLLKGQGKVTLDQAIQVALANNFDLQVARNDAAVVHNNNHAGNAGMLPDVTLNASDNPSLTNINQKYNTGATVERNNVFNNVINANVTASYILYNGSRVQATRQRLELLDEAGMNQFNMQVQNVLGNVITAYSNILRQQRYMDLLKQLNDLSQDRLDIVHSRQAAGMANNTDLYLAQLDLETQKQNMLLQTATIKKAYTDLNVLLNFGADSTYEVYDYTLGNKTLQKPDLDAMIKNNPSLLLAQNQAEIALQIQREIGAVRQPLVRLTGAYNYNKSQSQAGLTLYNQAMGPQAGISLTMPLFTGGVNQRNYGNAQLNAQSSEIREKQAMLNVQAMFEQAWQDYSTALLQIQSDSTAVGVAKDYMSLMQQRFSAGQNTIIELKEAQRSYEETYFRQISNQFIARLAEAQLLALTGQLAK